MTRATSILRLMALTAALLILGGCFSIFQGCFGSQTAAETAAEGSSAIAPVAPPAVKTAAEAEEAYGPKLPPPKDP